MSVFAGVPLAAYPTLIAYPTIGFLWPWLMRPRSEKKMGRWMVIVWRTMHFIAYTSLVYFQFVQYFLAAVGWNIRIHDYELKVNSSIIFPLGLATILHAYITQNSINFRRLCGSLVLANVAMILVIVLRRHGWFSSLTPKDWEPLWSKGAISILSLGACLQAIDIIIIISIHNHISNKKNGVFLRVALPLLLALIFDAASFSLVIASFRINRDYPIELSNQLPIKIIAGAIYASWISLYFYYFDGDPFIGSPVETTGNPAWRVLPRIFRKHRSTPALTPPVESDTSPYIMRNRESKDARGVPERQERDPLRQGGEPSGFVERLELSPGSELRRLTSKGIETFRREMPSLLRDHLNEWVAYRGETCIGFTPTQRDMYRHITENNIDQNELIITLINEDSLRNYDVEDLISPRSGVDLDSALLRRYAGQWVAWSPNGRDIVAHAEDPGDLEELLKTSGLDISQCVLDYVDETFTI